MSPEALTVVFAATLTIELAVIFAAFRRVDRRSQAARLALAAPFLSHSGDPEGPTLRWRDAALVRSPAGAVREREMREVVGLLRRLKIAPRHAASALMLAELALATVLAGLTLLVAWRLFPAGPIAWARIPLTLIAGAGGWSIPMLLAHRAADDRAVAVVRALPEAMELLVVCIEAGLSFEDALERITKALEDTEPKLAEELSLTAADMRVLANFDQGLGNLAARINAPDVRSVVTILSQSLRYGTPLADSLRAAATQMRDEALIKLEERGNRLPTLLTLPMMLLIFPTIFLVVVGPAALNALDTVKR